MHLREFTLTTPTIEAGQVFKAIESAIPLETVKEAIRESNRQTQRQRKLPAHLTVCILLKPTTDMPCGRLSAS